ncbi:LysR family transcriptional regulator [Microbacterium paraoxydans]|uniref:LysR family transcriptional regulator n=1 Tax=Microbacterium paraoxydans TaxID=199592 RepID=UPI001CFA89D0|nr:LysR family transcriptional regulator [Microbacterium paraoxydans]
MTSLPGDLTRTLAAVADAGSLDGAARELRVTPSAVSQRLKALETLLGQVVLVRSKPVRLTTTGAYVVRFARQAEMLERETLRGLGLLSEGASRRRATVAVEVDLSSVWLSAVARAAVVAPMDLHIIDEPAKGQSLSSDDIIFRVTTSPEEMSGTHTVDLGQGMLDAVAAPAFIDRWITRGAQRADFTSAPAVIVRGREARHQTFVEAASLASSSALSTVASTSAAKALLLEGAAWGLLPRYEARREIQMGRLHRVSTATAVESYYLRFAALESEALHVLAEHVQAAARTALGSGPTVQQGGSAHASA